VLIFKAVKISSPKAYLLLISTPAAVLSILTPSPSPWKGEGWPIGRGEVVDDGGHKAK